MHTFNDPGQQLDPAKQHKASEMVRNWKDFDTSQVEKSPPSSFDEAFHVQATCEFISLN